MDVSRLKEHDELVKCCADAVRRKLITTFSSVGESDTEISLVRSTIGAHVIPAHVRIDLTPHTETTVSPGAIVPPGAVEVDGEQEARILLDEHKFASPDVYEAAMRFVRDTFPGDGLGVGKRRTRLPNERFQFVVSYTKQCPTCGGQRQLSCPQCSGQRVMSCQACSGRGYKTTTKEVGRQGLGTKGTGVSSTGISGGRIERSGASVPVYGQVNEPCISCGGRGQVHCGRCSGSGAIACEGCSGTGCVTATHAMTYEIATTIKWHLEEVPKELAAWLRNQETGELVSEHVETESVTEAQASASRYAMRYDVTVPFGTASFRFAGNPEEKALVVAGKTGDIIQSDPFLEGTLPRFRKLRGHELAIPRKQALAVFADALKHPVVKIIATQALIETDADHDEVATDVRRMLPTGISHERICEVVDAARCYAHLTFDRRRALARLARNVLLLLVVFFVYFVFPLRIWVQLHTHAFFARLLDLSVLIAGLVSVRLIAYRTTLSEVRRTYSPLLDVGAAHLRPWERLSKHFTPSRKVTALVWVEVVLLYVLAAMIPVWMGKSPPGWIAWIFGR